MRGMMVCLAVAALCCAKFERTASPAKEAPPAVQATVGSVAPSTVPSPITDPFAPAYDEGKRLLRSAAGDGTKVQQARGLFMGILEKNRDYAPAYVGIARCEVANGYLSGWDYDPDALSRAWKLVQHALKLDPNLADAHLAAASIAIDREDFDVAKGYLESAERLRPGGEVAKELRGHLAEHEDRGQDLVVIARELIAGDDRAGRAQGYQFLINYYRARQQPDEVDAAYREQLKIEPESAWDHGNYAAFLLQRGSVDAAIAQAEQAVHILPYPRGLSVLAEGYAAKSEELWQEKRYDESAAYVEKIAALNGDDARLSFALGTLFERAAARTHDPHLRDRATRAYQNALLLDPKLEPARKALARLERK